MKEIKTESILQSVASDADLNEADCSLLIAAKKAVSTSYAPYSKFHVGCAIKLANGEVVTGSNQENIAFPSGLCAERVAIFYAGSAYPGVTIESIAITVKADEYTVDKPVMSCGACLQSMSEYELRQQQPIRVILQGETGEIYLANGLRTFMPFMFWIDELRK
jgi:cytidine deaminase